MRLSILPTILLVFLFLTTAGYATAEDDQSNAQEEQGADEAEQADEQAAESQTQTPTSQSGDGVTYNTFTVCSDSVIQVQDVKIYCDSPGTFYYGSGKYRNSPSCLPGDKGKVLIDFYIASDAIQSAGGYAYVDLRASGNGGWYQQNHAVFEDADLCSLSGLKKKSGNGCPYQGNYRIQTSFYWEDVQYDYLRKEFYPSVMVGFKSAVGQRSYDYGGANTVYCRGSTFATWTDGVRKTYANAISNFMMSFGILLFTIAIMGGFIWFLLQKPTSVKDAGRKLGVIKRDVFAEDEFDFSKLKSPHNGQNLVDF